VAHTDEDYYLKQGGVANPLIIRGRAECMAAAFAIAFVLGVPSARAQIAVPSGPATGGPSAGTPGPAGGPGAPGTPAGAAAPGPAAGFAPLGPQAGLGSAFTITAGISDNETFNDNVLFTAKQRKSDLVSTLAPVIYLNSDTARLQTSVSYSPQFIKYAAESSQDQIAQSLAGNATYTAITDRLFVDANAASAVVNRTGGLGFGNQVQIPASQGTQTTVYTLSPYATFHFGEFGDSQLRYAFSQNLFSGNTGPVFSPTTGTTVGSISSSTSQTGTATYNTGEYFARLQFGANATYSQQDGGTNATSRQESGTVNATYEISPPVSLLASIGYQRVTFSQTQAGNFNGITYNVGASYEPRPDRHATLNYGESEGTTSVSGNAYYELTPLITVTGSYTVQTVTAQQQLVQNLANLTPTAPGSTITPSGVSVPSISSTQQIAGTIINPLTGLPANLQNPNLALQNAVDRSKTLQLGVTLESGQRNHYSLTLNRTEATALNVGGTSQTSTGGLLTWGHDLNPLMGSVVSAGYSRTSSSAVVVAGAANISTITFNAGLTYAIGPTLNSSVNYSFLRESGGLTGPIQDDIVSVALLKTF
jgi:uncharacterized protein (PEP-CTERM system associated)